MKKLQDATAHLNGKRALLLDDGEYRQQQRSREADEHKRRIARREHESVPVGDLENTNDKSTKIII